TIFSSELDPHVKTFGNRLPARTIRYRPPKVDSGDWLKLEMKQMSLWETEPCVSVCIKWSDFNGIMEQMRKSCKELLDDNDTLNMLRESNFDLLYAETFDCCAPGIAQVSPVRDDRKCSCLFVSRY
ncbi:unnamed protein product, partial [Heligmosomoides polygyrus]|uniref:Glucuronosyltransferase n=1 Tax=Heligmosomoides polygyrus TaxID=6339 RepID=A0A183GX32_HELPZ